jgi:aminopeptidase N
MRNKKIPRCLFSFFLVVFFFIQSLPFASSARPLWMHNSFSTNERKGTAELRPQRTYDVQHYIIRVKFNRQTKTIFGDVSVRLKPLAQGFKTFNLDADDLKVSSVKLESSNKNLLWDIGNDKLNITLDRDYKPAETINIRIIYQTQPRRGLYFTTQGKNRGFNIPAQIWTQGQPEDNSSWFPCYDFPDDKATTEQFITTASDELAIGNGVLVDTKINRDKTKTYHWRMDVPHATYLTSLVVGNYTKIEDKYRDTTLEYYVYPGSEETSRKAFAQTPHIMELFESDFRFPFPYKRYAQTIVADFYLFAGMENITSTTLADFYFLQEYADQNEGTEELISHELAHSWFGNLVTCKNWSHLWLNEGFATFMEAVYKEQTQGRKAYLNKLKSDAITFIASEAYSSHPLVNKYYSLGSELFDATTYQKGAVVINMLRRTVGDEIFWKAINAYLNEFKYKTVETTDLQKVFERVSGQNLNWFFDQWVYKAGFPELKANYVYDKNSRTVQLHLEQTQDFNEMKPEVFRLFIDIEIVTSKGTRKETIEMNQRKQTFSFNIDDELSQVWVDRESNLLRLLDFPQAKEQIK